MRLLDFINTHENWEELLSGAPYFIKIKWDGDYFICNYSQFASDFSIEEVQEARGSIFYRGETGIKCVCRPFKKFFNYGEPNAAEIDWSTACVTEKIDGSLMKMWYHDRRWHLSTNGTINAFDTFVGDYGISFGQLFEKALGYTINVLGRSLWTWCTYCFELTSPESQVVIPYDYKIWLLTAFDTMSGYEISSPFPKLANISRPQVYNLSNLDKVIKVVGLMDKTHEGVVVSDRDGNRIKVKSPTYLEMAHIVNAGNKVTKGLLLDYVLTGRIDDFLGIMPQYVKLAERIKEEITAIAAEMEQVWRIIMYRAPKSRKEFALSIPEYIKPIVKQFLFTKYEHPEISAISWIFTLPSKKVMELIGEQ